jgi:Spondin_N
MRRLLLLVLALGLTVALTAATATADSSAQRSWRVTVQNLTPAGSQPLSPPLLAVHGKRVDVWSVGAIANHGVAAIAEDANNAPLESALGQLAGVRDVFTGAGGAIAPGESRTYTVEGRAGRDRLTLLTMLVNTNDGFTGLDSLLLRGTRVLYRMAYDAGSERNNELVAFIPGPCCNNPFVRDPEGALIAPHAGITGVGELDPAVYGWDEPVVKITIERLG